MNSKKIIIAIDGHSSCGKSTVAKQLAKHFQYRFIDTGAMYRAVTLFALRNNLAANGQVDAAALVARLGEIHINFKFNELTGTSDAWLNGENVEQEIRQLPVSNHVSPVATIKEVRQAMVAQQQEMGREKGIVMDGRDIGTVVFPSAELKLFMTASAEIRAKRRFDELQAKGEAVDFAEILQNVTERDRIDSTRTESPLIQASDAIVLDNSHIGRDEQLQWAIRLAESKLNSPSNAH
jgi:CMP/dCMP kinase